MAEDIVTPSQEPVEAPQGTNGEEPKLSLRPDEQEALDAYRKSQQSQEERDSEAVEGYNPDGTPKEELIGGKFKSQEDLLNAYAELEKKLSAPKETPKEETPKETGEPTTEVTNNEGVKVDVSKFNQEFIDKGELTSDSYQELENLGFSKREVDLYIEGQKALGNQFTTGVYETVGGEENYNKLVAWAPDNIDGQVLKEYNEALANLDTTTAKRHLDYMQYKMSQAQPTEVRRLEGQASDNGMAPFADKSEWFRAQGNRLYGKDKNYTNMVDKRYLASRKKGLI